MNIIAHLFRGFRNVSIRWKSIAVFASLLFVVLALGTLSIVRLGMVKEAGETISASWMPGVQRAGEIAEAMNGYRHAESALVMSPDDDTMAETTKNLALALSQIQAARDKLAKLPTAPEEADYITKFVSAWESYLDLSKRIVGLVGNKKVADAADLLTGDSAYQFSKAKAFIARLLIAKVRGGDEAVARSNVVYRATIPIMLSAIVVVVVLCLSAAAFVVLGVARPLNRMTAVVGQMAGGQLDIVDDDMPGLGRGDEFGALAKALAVLRDSARERVRLEREAAETRAAADLRQAEMERHTQDFGMSVSGVMVMLSDAADGIRRSAETMTGTAESTRTQADTTTSGSIEAAQGLASVAAAAEEMAVTATEIGRRISDVAASTNAAVEAAGRSEQIVAALVGAVAEIGSVVQLISDIAGQTNLLTRKLRKPLIVQRHGFAGYPNYL